MLRHSLQASEIGIIALLSGSFSRIVFIAVIIALSVSYLAANYWLNNFAYKIALQWWYFAAAGLIAMVIAWLTVGTQALKAARVNPTKCLKDE
jgi:putative ABC transport system permease protein